MRISWPEADLLKCRFLFYEATTWNQRQVDNLFLTDYLQSYFLIYKFVWMPLFRLIYN